VPVDTPDIKGEYDILVNELTKYNPEMLDKGVYWYQNATCWMMD
jgi:hypothetical protein